LGGGIVVIIIMIMIFAASSINRNNQIAAENATGTMSVMLATSGVETATQLSIDGTATQRAIATETPTPTETSSRPTLPPSWTPSLMPTLAETAAPLPPVTGLRGFIAAISGIDVLNNDFLSVGYFNLEQGGTYNLINDDYGRDPSFRPDGQRVVYVRYDQLSFSSVIEFVNINGTDVENLTATDAGLTMLAPEQTQFSRDGRLVTFIARGTGVTYQVFVYDLFADEVRQLTNSDSEFSHPSFSPDGTRIAAIRDDVASSNPGADIVLIDVTTGGQVAVSTDRAAFIETMPRWSSDGQQIIYSVASANDPNNYDIFVRNANGTGSPLPLVREPGSELYPVVSPDGQNIAFSSNRTGVWDIYVYNIQQGTLAQLTQSPEEDYPTDWWQPFS
jgi:dipeptidyl aminopeptidase/acylaminoacyl peptidase